MLCCARVIKELRMFCVTNNSVVLSMSNGMVVGGGCAVVSGALSAVWSMLKNTPSLSNRWELHPTWLANSLKRVHIVLKQRKILYKLKELVLSVSTTTG